MDRDPQLQAQREALAETRARIAAMEALLEELPALFEAKFKQRIAPLLEQQQQLLQDNADLRQQLLLRQAPEPPRRRFRLLPPAGGDAPPTAASADPTHR